MSPAKPQDTGGRLWIEEGEQREGVVAEVAPLLPVDRTYSFAVPQDMEGSLAVGQRVTVPLGRRAKATIGFVVALDRGVWDSTLKPIDSLVDSASFLAPEMIELGREIAIHYCCPLGRTLKAMTPEAVRKRSGLTKVRFARLVQTVDEIESSGKRISPARRALVDALAGANQPVRIANLLSDTGTSPAVLRGIEKLGWIEITIREEISPPDDEHTPLVEPTFELNHEQRTALDAVNQAVDADRFSVTLLFGVSGSGKTEVYIRSIRRVIEQGKQAILLVPEIVLTTQLVARLASRFPRVAVNHSGLTDAQRSVMWQRLASGEMNVVIGTRSAVFAPCPNLGLICVDEEQETSFKNLQAPRFNVRDVAIMRAKRAGFPVVVGSATPSLETWHLSRHHRDYRQAKLTSRIRDLPMPKVHVVDMDAEQAAVKRPVALSRLMERLLGETVDRGEQALVLINRRGFARGIFCPTCDLRLSCPNCNVGLVVHSATGQSICHYCQSRMTTPRTCPTVGCGGRLTSAGMGTQRIEHILASRFPKVRIERVDSDTMRHRSHYERIVTEFEARRIDVLVGTQMIAKGLDFPFVSFVGMVHADAEAISTDFRAHERLFQLITQVAGRAGRADVPGQVVVQTTMPDLPALKHALSHDYPSFARGELLSRERVGWPPFRRLARIVLSHPREEVAEREALALSQRVKAAIDSLSLKLSNVLGPNPCALSRIRGQYRYDLLIRTMDAKSLRLLLATLRTDGALQTKAKTTIIDVDPVSLS